MDVRTDNGRGKLLFKWNPVSQEVCIVKKNKMYRIRLLMSGKDGYEILESSDKDGGRDPPTIEDLKD